MAGTAAGITAVQLDVKLPGIDVNTLISALQPAAKARDQVLSVLETAVHEYEQSLPDKLWPQYGSVEINKELIARLIGVQVNDHLLTACSAPGMQVCSMCMRMHMPGAGA